MSRTSWVVAAAGLALIFAITAPTLVGFVLGFTHGPPVLLPRSGTETLLLLTGWAFMFLTIQFTAWCAEKADRGIAALIGLVFATGALAALFWAGSEVPFAEMLSAEVLLRTAIITLPAVVAGALLRERLAPSYEKPTRPLSPPSPEPPQRGGPTLPRAA